jgi:hypothetical protein
MGRHAGVRYAPMKEFTLQFRVIPQERFLLAHIDGLVSFEAWDNVLRGLQQDISAAQCDRLVVNLTALVGWLGLPERTAVGALMASRLAQMKRVALVIQAEKITGAVEKEAQRNGLDLRLFSDYDQAVSWAVA